jgi:hypothetical protein
MVELGSGVLYAVVRQLRDATIELLEAVFTMWSVPRLYHSTDWVQFSFFSWEKMLHKDYDRESSVGEKISGRETQGAWRQDDLIGGKPSVVK